MPTVSIIVPVYKVEKYIHRCIESILLQTYTDFELILVDDGSPDLCGAICDGYAQKDSRIMVIHQNNSGVSFARNTALSVASGKYILFCDSDDYIECTWLAELVKLANESNADLVSAGFTYCDANGNLKRTKTHEQIQFSFGEITENIDFIIYKVLLGELGWEVWTKLFKKEIIRDNTILFCETCDNFAEDMGFVIEYLLYCKQIMVSRSTGYNYIEHTGSMMDQSKNTVKLNAMNEVSKHFAEHYFRHIKLTGQDLLFPVIYFLIMWNQYQKIVYTEDYKQLAKYINQIKDTSWFKKNTWTILGRYPIFLKYFGKECAKKIMLITAYCLHQNWRLHSYISFLLYKYILKNTD